VAFFTAWDAYAFGRAVIDGGKSSASGPCKCSRRKASYFLAGSIHDPDTLREISSRYNLAEQVHSAHDFESRAPEIYDVTACPRSGADSTIMVSNPYWVSQ
jgi:hypothetical protein